MVKTWPFKGLSDLQLGDRRITLNHLVFISGREILLVSWVLDLLDGFWDHEDSEYQNQFIG